MRDIQISKPVVIALVAAILVGGFMFMRGGQSDEVIAPTTPTASATAATGATGGASGATGATGGSGATGETKSKAELKKEARAKLVKKAEEAGLPVEVYKAKRAGKEVIVFFWEPEGKDDERTNDALLDVEEYRKGHVVVFRDEISNASLYDGIAEAAELTQTPSMVLIYRDKADTAQGYYDATAINQKLERLSGYSP